MEFRSANLDGAAQHLNFLIWIPWGWKVLSSPLQAPSLPFVQYSADPHIFVPAIWTCASQCEPWAPWGTRLSRTIHSLVESKEWGYGIWISFTLFSFPSLIIPFHWDELDFSFCRHEAWCWRSELYPVWIRIVFKRSPNWHENWQDVLKTNRGASATASSFANWDQTKNQKNHKKTRKKKKRDSHIIIAQHTFPAPNPEAGCVFLNRK